MKFQDKIGIVTVLYKSEKVLEDFFHTLNQQSYDNFILYVIDNNSPDNSLTVSERLSRESFFETKFIKNDDNYGVAKGNNQGIEAALADKCEYILLSNNDVVLKPDTIEKLYIGLQETNADMVVPKIYIHGTNRIWAAGGKFVKSIKICMHFGSNDIDLGQYDNSQEVTYSPTCFMLIKNDTFIDVGLMDEKYFVYSDDTDFVYRALLKKKKLFYIFSSNIEHKESVSTGKSSDFTYYYTFRNRIYFVKKHHPICYIFTFVANIIFHYTIRNYNFKANRYQWKLIGRALLDGLMM